jgi:aspartate/methionine/tyrosine aminotransferase
MNLRDFKLEVFFEKYEFTAPYLLTQSDCESMTVSELLAMEPDSEKMLKDIWLGYTEVPGHPGLRELIASSLYRNMQPENIVVYTGAQEGIYAYMNVLLAQGDHVICMFPTYQSLYEVALSKGLEVSKWNLKQTDNKWRPDFDELKSLIKDNTKLIIVNTPNNPTGYTLNENEIRELCKIAEEKDIYVFADEVYKNLDLDGVSKPWIADMYDKATSVGVMSKAYGLAGLRVGWLASKDTAILEKATKYKHYLSINTSCVCEFLSILALKHSDKILKRNLDIIRENLNRANAFFAKYENLFVNNPPQCGPIAFHKLKLDIKIDEFCDDLVQKTGVLLLPATAYEYPDTYFRMGYGRKEFEVPLNKLEEYINKYL